MLLTVLPAIGKHRKHGERDEGYEMQQKSPAAAELKTLWLCSVRSNYLVIFEKPVDKKTKKKQRRSKRLNFHFIHELSSLLPLSLRLMI